MRNTLLLFVFLLNTTFIFSQSDERLSVHYFDVPQELESDFLKFNSDVNKELEKAFANKFKELYPLALRLHTQDSCLERMEWITLYNIELLHSAFNWLTSEDAN